MSVIGRSIVIDGDVSSAEDLQIEGRVQGSVSVRDALLTVGTTAHVSAELRAPRIVVLGDAHGTITASERIELGASSRVTGQLSANFVVIAEGARFNGRIDMAQRSIAVKVAQHKRDNPT